MHFKHTTLKNIQMAKKEVEFLAALVQPGADLHGVKFAVILKGTAGFCIPECGNEDVSGSWSS